MVQLQLREALSILFNANVKVYDAYNKKHMIFIDLRGYRICVDKKIISTVVSGLKYSIPRYGGGKSIITGGVLFTECLETIGIKLDYKKFIMITNHVLQGYI